MSPARILILLVALVAGIGAAMLIQKPSQAPAPAARIEQAPRVQTLIAKKIGPSEYRFDIRLQGEGETVFLDL